MFTKRYSAVIDIGTNSILLLIAQKREALPHSESRGSPGSKSLLPLVDRAKTVRLGENLISTGYLSPAAMARTLDGLKSYFTQVQTFSPVDVTCFGTEALRRAHNAHIFCQQVKATLNWDVRILSPAEEAHYTFTGALSSLADVASHEKYLVIDIGGGSTELVYGTVHSIEYQTSVAIGAVVVKDMYQLENTISTTTLEVLQNQVKRLFQQLPELDDKTSVLLTGGTATTLAALDQALTEYDIAAIDGYSMEFSTIATLYNQLNQLSLVDREALPGMEPGRADVILPALIILITLLEQLDMQTVQISVRGARYGILF